MLRIFSCALFSINVPRLVKDLFIFFAFFNCVDGFLIGFCIHFTIFSLLVVISTSSESIFLNLYFFFSYFG